MAIAKSVAKVRKMPTAEAIQREKTFAISDGMWAERRVHHVLPIAASRPHISSSQSFCKQMLAADAPKSIEA
jgi:hypothetical protein